MRFFFTLMVACLFAAPAFAAWDKCPAIVDRSQLFMGGGTNSDITVRIPSLRDGKTLQIYTIPYSDILFSGCSSEDELIVLRVKKANGKALTPQEENKLKPILAEEQQAAAGKKNQEELLTIRKERFKNESIPQKIIALAQREQHGEALSEQDKQLLVEADDYVKKSLVVKPICQVRDKNAEANRGKSGVHIAHDAPTCTSEQIKSAVHHGTSGLKSSFGYAESTELYYDVDEKTLAATNKELRATQKKWSGSAAR